MFRSDSASSSLLTSSLSAKDSDTASVTVETGSILSDLAKEFEEQKLANRFAVLSGPI